MNKPPTPQTQRSDLFERCKKEIIELHSFFEKWFRGELPPVDEELERLRNALSDSFTMISPDGSCSGKEKTIQYVHDKYGAHETSDPPFEIEIKNVQAIRRENDHCLITYEEWQTGPGTEGARVSTVLFQENTRSPNGVEWMYLQETRKE